MPLHRGLCMGAVQEPATEQQAIARIEQRRDMPAGRGQGRQALRHRLVAQLGRCQKVPERGFDPFEAGASWPQGVSGNQQVWIGCRASAG